MANTGFRIDLPTDYFARIAAREYTDGAGLALVREFAQNAADAGATEVRFTFGLDNMLTVEDNGAGCTAEQVRQRLLTPLGTFKSSEEAVGGFGKAKELLYFANPSWRIMTQDVAVVGSYLTVESFLKTEATTKGFMATVKLVPGLYTAAWNAVRNFMRCSERPNLRWVLNNEEVTNEVKRPVRCVRDFGFAKIYLDTASHDSVVYLRTGGLLTSTRWGPHARDGGRVIIEVTGRSYDVLTPARDWFANVDQRHMVERWLHDLATNTTKALAEHFGDQLLFRDFEAPPAKEDLPTRMQIPTLDNGTKRPEITVEMMTEAAPVEAGTPVAELAAKSADPVVPVRAVKRQGFDMAVMPRVPGVAHVAVHTGGKEQAKLAMRWLKKNAQQAQQLLAAWTTAVMAVAAKNSLPVDAVGFTFALNADAEFTRTSEARFALLLNPLQISLDDHLADELLDRALHETAHLAGPIEHNEKFVTTEFNLRRAVRGPSVRGVIARALRTAEVVTLDEEA